MTADPVPDATIDNSEITPLGPDSVAWKVFGDLTFVLGAPRRQGVGLAVRADLIALGQHGLELEEFLVFPAHPRALEDRRGRQPEACIEDTDGGQPVGVDPHR